MGEGMSEYPAKWPWGTPPLWARHITPWWELRWINRNYNLCWANMAMWKMGYDWEWKPGESCYKEALKVGHCWCWKWCVERGA